MATVSITQIKVEGAESEVATAIAESLRSFVVNDGTTTQKKTAETESRGPSGVSSVRACLAAAGKPMKCTEIMAAVDRSQPYVSSCLRKLVESREVKREKGSYFLAS